MSELTSPAPILEDFDLLSPDYLNDPMAALYDVRQRTPIFYVPELNCWIPTRYRDIETVLRDATTFSSASAQIPPLSPSLEKLVPKEDEQIVRQLFANQLVFNDPPQHNVERRSAQRTFNRKQVDIVVPAIEKICDELIDGFAARGSADLMESFARRFSIRVVGTMLGLDVNDLDRFQRMVDSFFALMAPAGADAKYLHSNDNQIADSFAGLVEGYHHFARIVDERRACPGDDMASSMIQLKDDDGNSVMTTAQILAHMVGIVAAGTDTTSNLICSMVYRLTLETEVRDAAIADPTLWPAVVEECLRRESPGDKALRTVTRDTELAGYTIPQGSAVLVLFAAANGDPDVFDNPLRLDLRRPEIKESRHFGAGRHNCLGAPIVRPEANIAMRRLYTRLPGLTASLETPPDFEHSMMRARRSLPVRWRIDSSV
ncbi:cytochrome P450 [Rhodococcus sp. LB1]|uniref:cytochrome P450 n=1 Tax=Rhodococcus sp. LB1 TaxID=1807499 RepID=UPI000B28BD70|nr:cytochrome P450 [Rhodococcus sp. LB1]